MINKKYCQIHKNLDLVQICANQNCQRDKLMCIECLNEHLSNFCTRGLSFQTIETNLINGTIKDYKIEYDKIKIKIDHSIQTVIKKLQELKLSIENQYKTIFNQVDTLLNLKQRVLKNGVCSLSDSEIKQMKPYFCNKNYESEELNQEIINMSEKAQNLLEWAERINFNQYGNNPTDGESIMNKQNYQIYFNYQNGILNGNCYYKLIDRHPDQKEVLGVYRNGKKEGPWKQIILVREDQYINKFCVLYQTGEYSQGKKIGEWTYFYEDHKLCSQFYNNQGQLNGQSEQIHLFNNDKDNYGVSKSQFIKGLEIAYIGFEKHSFPKLCKSQIRPPRSEIIYQSTRPNIQTNRGRLQN